MKGKSTLFLMEQLVVIAVFAICAAVCVKILAISFLMTTGAVDTRYALLAAENAAESHKYFAGNTERIAEVLNGMARDGAVVVYYDTDWQPTNGGDAAFILRLGRRGTDTSVVFADISVCRIDGGENLISFTAATRERVQ